MTKTYPAIMASLYDEMHCILPSKLLEIEAFLTLRVKGEQGITLPRTKPPDSYALSLDGESCALEKMAAGSPANQFVAVLPLFGTMFQHGGIEMDASGGTSTEQFGQQFQALDKNPAVKTIVLEVHSPGGQVFGTGELAEVVRAARDRGSTRIVAVANSMAASAALWVATQASELHVTPGGEVGSIGVLTMHQDISKLEEKEGVKTTLLAVPDAKIEGHEFAPLDDSVRDKILARVEQTFERFVSGVAAGRRVSPAKVKADFGGGDMLRANEAVAAGLADGVASKGEVLAREVKLLRRSAGGSRLKNAASLALAEKELTLGG